MLLITTHIPYSSKNSSPAPE